MILEIVSPEATLFKGEVTSVSLPGVDGSFQILNNHAPIVSILKQGAIKISATSFHFEKEVENKFTRVNDQNYTLEINSGTIEMKDNKVIVLAD
ncbi:F0F1 ATP synthase subunit epsilon [Flavobacterium aciduliphilum]|jgi:F-type H+-transporting ATPase subunit epsilon|uniref:F-type H+-transporting ATPase subunit epsilon n=1 Tax=Flavobacterium aciduliphilum TaxID=1101402 RepID=A0A328YHI9_9FLAO|nr:F0F1 ATP synthase subunit epsilon [Flavobacterium aciduliphilum]RAR72573.1 F-type H+-transporting ATPase subunit epsilon [Flavobacterium aciduliphilum]